MNRILSILNNEEPIYEVFLQKKDGKRSKKKIKDLTVKPLFNDKDDYVEAPHENLLRMPFSLLEVAPKGSGKTVLLQMVISWYFKMFDNVFIWSPTLDIDKKWNKFIDKFEIQPENLFTSVKEKQVDAIMEKIKRHNMALGDKEGAKKANKMIERFSTEKT